MLTTSKTEGKLVRVSSYPLPPRPPGHPDLAWGVLMGCGGIMCLSVAAEAAYVSPEVKEFYAKAIERYRTNRAPLEDAAVQNWILRVLSLTLARYRDPKRPEPECWMLGYAEEVGNWTPMDHLDDHIGVHWIKTWYPGWVPEAVYFRNAEEIRKAEAFRFRRGVVH